MSLSIRTLLVLVAVACVAPASALAAAKPAVKTGVAYNVSPTAANVTGAVNPNGLVTTWYFQYGKSAKYGARTTALDAGSGKKQVPEGATLTGLSGKTTYHYRLVATNSAGTTFGADRTFKTPEAPTTSSIAANPNPAVAGGLINVSGFLVGPRGGGGKRVALEAKAFPFTAGFTQIGNTLVTAPDGSYQFATNAFFPLQLRVVDRSDPSIVSPLLVENVMVNTGLRHSRRSKRGVVRFYGNLTPVSATAAVVIQRRTPKGGWRNVAVTLPHGRAGKPTGQYSRRLRVRRGVFRAIARATGGYSEGISRSVRVR
jgi:hypothetical protein